MSRVVVLEVSFESSDDDDLLPLNPGSEVEGGMVREEGFGVTFLVDLLLPNPKIPFEVFDNFAGCRGEEGEDLLRLGEFGSELIEEVEMTEVGREEETEDMAEPVKPGGGANPCRVGKSTEIRDLREGESHTGANRSSSSRSYSSALSSSIVSG